MEVLAPTFAPTNLDFLLSFKSGIGRIRQNKPVIIGGKMKLNGIVIGKIVFQKVGKR